MNVRDLHAELTVRVPHLCSPYEPCGPGAVRLVFAFWDYSADRLSRAAGLQWFEGQAWSSLMRTVIVGFEPSEAIAGYASLMRRKRVAYISLASVADPVDAIKAAVHTLLEAKVHPEESTGEIQRLEAGKAAAILRHDLTAALCLVQGSLRRMSLRADEAKQQSGYQSIGFLPERLLRRPPAISTIATCEPAFRNAERLWTKLKAVGAEAFREETLQQAIEAATELVYQLEQLDLQLQSEETIDPQLTSSEPTAAGYAS